MGKSRGTDGVIRDCLIESHANYGAICLGCATELTREERANEREQCAKAAEATGLWVGAIVAKAIRNGHAPPRWRTWRGETGGGMSISDYDRAHVDEIVRGKGDWFGAQLLRLIAKSDRANRERLRSAFPEHVAAYEDWFDGRGERLDRPVGERVL